MNDFEWLQEARRRDPLSFDDTELRDARRRMSESPELCEMMLGDPALAVLAERIMSLPDPAPESPVAVVAPPRYALSLPRILAACAVAMLIGLVTLWRALSPATPGVPVAQPVPGKPVAQAANEQTQQSADAPANESAANNPPMNTVPPDGVGGKSVVAAKASDPAATPPTPNAAEQQAAATKAGAAMPATAPTVPPATNPAVNPAANPAANNASNANANAAAAANMANNANTNAAAKMPTTSGSPAASPVAVAEPAPEPLPWQAVLDAQEAPLSFTSLCWDGFDAKLALPTRETLQQWFEPVPGHGLRLTDTRLPNGRCGSFEGVMRLRAPLGDDRVLRLAVDNFPRLQLHFFAGDEGVSFVWSQDDPHWSVYSVRRDPATRLARNWRLIANDAGRARRAEFRAGGPWELRYHDGRVKISRGDVVVAHAPLAAVPTDIIWQGRATFYGLALARTADAPAAQPRWPEHAERWEEATALPTASPNDWTVQLPENATWSRDSDGVWWLECDGAARTGWVAAPLPQAGPREIVVQLLETTPGCGVFLAGSDKLPRQVLRVTLDKRTGQKAFAWCGDDNLSEVPMPAVADAVAPFTHDAPWIRLVVGCGLVRAWQSGDGQDWVELPAVARYPTRGISYVGVHHVGGKVPVKLALRNLWVRPLAELAATAEPQLATQAAMQPAVRDTTTAAAYRQAIQDARPADIEERRWKRACAAVTLGHGADRDVAQAALDDWLDALDPALPPERHVRVLAEAAALLDLADLPAVAQAFVARFHRLAWSVFESTGEPPLAAIRQLFQETAFRLRLNDTAFEPRNVRADLLHALYHEQWEEAIQQVRQLRYFHQQAQTPLLDWTDTIARRATPGRDAPAVVSALPAARVPSEPKMPRSPQIFRGVGAPGRPRPWQDRRPQRSRQDAIRGKDGWLHPLNEELGKETYNALAELDSLIGAAAFDDAARLIAQFDPALAPGVAPLDADDELLASLRSATRWFAAQHPELSDAMRAQFDKVAPLRLRPATRTGEPSAVELVAQQYAGTVAAAEAHLWLGDRALAAGEFGPARAAYRRAQPGLPAVRRAALDARLRLVNAYLGVESGTPPTQPVTLGPRPLAVAEFEAMVAAALAQASSVPPAENAVSAATLVAGQSPAPKPAKEFAPQARGLLDGPVGERPQEEVVRHLDRLQVDWAGQQLAWVAAGGRWIVSNRFQLAAFDPQGGQRVWQTTALEGKRVMRSRDWGLVPMKPVVAGTRVFARMLYGDGPTLGCWDTANGNRVWLAEPPAGVWIASDPWLDQGRVRAFTIQRLDGPEATLRLAAFHAGTGELLEQIDVVQLRVSWFARYCCEVAVADDTLLAVIGGAVIACDRQGHVQWIRREVVLPTDEDAEWVLQSFQPPVVRAGRAYVCQPGVRAVDCLEIDTGRRLWRRFAPDVRRLAAVLDDRLIVATERGLEAIALEDGKPLWRRDLPGLAPSLAAGGPHGLLAARTVPHSDPKKLLPELLWLDPATGATTATAPLEPFADPAPRLGPLFSSGDRLFVFFGRGQTEAKRELFECVSK